MRELDFGDYNEKLSRSGRDVLALAIEESRRRQQNYFAAEHLFLAAVKVERKLFEDIAKDLGISREKIVNDISKHLDLSKQFVGKGLKITFSMKSIFRLAWVNCFQDGREKIQSYDLFSAIFQEGANIVVEIFRSNGVEPEKVDRILRKHLQQRKLIRVEAENIEKVAAEEIPEDKKQAVRDAIVAEDFGQAYKILSEFYLENSFETEEDDVWNNEEVQAVSAEEEVDHSTSTAGLRSYAYGILFAAAALLVLAILIRSLIQFGFLH